MRRTMLALVLVSAPAIAPALAPTAAVAAPPVPRLCRGATLPVPAGIAGAFVTTADPTGTLVFGSSLVLDEAFKRQVLGWKNGTVFTIDVPGVDQFINSVNSAGVGAAVSFDPSDVPTAFVYRDGVVTVLPGGEGGYAAGINSSNTIVGDKAGRPVIWRSPTSPPTELPLPPGFTSGRARAIDDDGTVVGEIFSGDKTVAFVWTPDGTGRILPPPPGGPTRFGYSAFTIRNGWVTGVDQDNASDEAGLRWDLRTDRMQTVPGFLGRPSTANASGWMVGTDLKGHGSLQADGTTLTLRDIFTAVPGEFSNLPETISDDGRTIAGQADDLDGNIHPAIWRCS